MEFSPLYNYSLTLHMELRAFTFIISLLSFIVFPGRATSQTIGPFQQFSTHDEDPWLGSPRLFTHGDRAYYQTDIPASKAGQGIFGFFIAMELDGSKAQQELSLEKPDIPGSPYFTGFYAYDGALWALFQTFDKETGKVEIYTQQYTAELTAINGVVKIGTVSLDLEKNSRGVPYATAHVSPDGSKLLISYDGVHSGNFDLAICWVLDGGELQWHGTYKLPVQALGAESTTHVFDNGAVSISINAVELDESNTRERSDGSTVAQVDMYYMKDRTTSLFMLHDKVFSQIDGALLEGKLRGGQLSHGPAGWVFIGLLERGKGKNAVTERVLGHFGPEGVSIKERYPLEEFKANNQVLLDKAGAFYTTHGSDRGPVTVTKLDQDGKELWSHTAPLGRIAAFKVIEDRLMASLIGTKGSLANLQEGEAARVEVEHYMGCIPLLVFWNDGRRTAHSVMPIDTPTKDAHAVTVAPTSITKAGLWFTSPRIEEQAIGFVPFIW